MFQTQPGKRGIFAFPVSLGLLVLVLILAGCGGSNGTAQSTPTTNSSSSSAGGDPGKYGLAVLPGYQVSLFASGTSSYNNPDAVEVDNGHVFIDYQNTTAKDCTDTNSSTV